MTPRTMSVRRGWSYQSGYYLAGVTALGLAIVMYVISHVAPFWIRQTPDLNIGVWFLCKEGGDCFNHNFPTDPVYLKATRILQVLGMAGLLAAVAAVFFTNCRRAPPHTSYLPETLIALSALLGLSGAMVYFGYTLPVVDEQAQFRYDWAFYANVTACVLALLGALVIWLPKICCRGPGSDKSTDTKSLSSLHVRETPSTVETLVQRPAWVRPGSMGGDYYSGSRPYSPYRATEDSLGGSGGLTGKRLQNRVAMISGPEDYRGSDRYLVDYTAHDTDGPARAWSYGSERPAYVTTTATVVRDRGVLDRSDSGRVGEMEEMEETRLRRPPSSLMIGLPPVRTNGQLTHTRGPSEPRSPHSDYFPAIDYYYYGGNLDEMAASSHMNPGAAATSPSSPRPGHVQVLPKTPYVNGVTAFRRDDPADKSHAKRLSDAAEARYPGHRMRKPSDDATSEARQDDSGVALVPNQSSLSLESAGVEREFPGYVSRPESPHQDREFPGYASRPRSPRRDREYPGYVSRPLSPPRDGEFPGYSSGPLSPLRRSEPGQNGGYLGYTSGPQSPRGYGGYAGYTSGPMNPRGHREYPGYTSGPQSPLRRSDPGFHYPLAVVSQPTHLHRPPPPTAMVELSSRFRMPRVVVHGHYEPGLGGPEYVML